MVVGGAYDKRQVIEEPDEAKVSRPVLKTNGIGDNFIEFNSNEELNYAQKFVQIPTHESYQSLNLATAVGICCYELAQLTTQPVNESTTSPELASWDMVEAYYQQLESLLLKIGYLYPHTATSRMEKFRQLYNRTQMQTTEVAMLRGMLRQIEWAIENYRE